MKNDDTDKLLQPEHSVITEEDSTVTPELRQRVQAIIDDLNQPEQTRKAVDYAVKLAGALPTLFVALRLARICRGARRRKSSGRWMNGANFGTARGLCRLHAINSEA